jgi:hypothetical protein
VLGPPPAFVLSQDQTLRCSCFTAFELVVPACYRRRFSQSGHFPKEATLQGLRYAIFQYVQPVKEHFPRISISGADSYIKNFANLLQDVYQKTTFFLFIRAFKLQPFSCHCQYMPPSDLHSHEKATENITVKQIKKFAYGQT